MFFLLMQAWAQPNSFVSQHLEIVQETSFREALISRNITHSVLKREQKEMMAEGLFRSPGLLSLLNRYGAGVGTVEELATGKSTLLQVSGASRKEFFWTRADGTRISVLSLTKQELYPIADPFSPYRAEMFHHSLHAFQKECKKFTLDKAEHRFLWRGTSCSFGKVWLEWNPTEDFSFVALIVQ